MASTWTDPNGTVHQYQTAGDGLEAKARRAVERQQVWAGIDPTFDNQQFQVSDDGKIVKQEHVNKLLAGAMLAGPLAAAFLPGALAAPAANSTATSAAIPSTAVQAGGVTGGILPGTEAGLVKTLATKTATSHLADWLAPAISAGTGIAGSLIQKSSNDKATDAQTKAADEALALRKQMYEQDRADYAPYRNIGAFSLGELGHLVGKPPTFGTEAVADATKTNIPMNNGMAGLVPIPNAPPGSGMGQVKPIPNQPVGQPLTKELMSLGELGAAKQTSSSFVRMRAPNGDEADIHPSELPIFEAQGAVRVR